MQKLYCYIDETGQDTQGEFYLVSVVIVQQERDTLTQFLERIEHETGKYKRKWNKAKKEWRIAYIRRVLSEPLLQGKLYYGTSTAVLGYVHATIQTTADAIKLCATAPYKATVFVDGLSRSEERIFSNGLKHCNIKTEKVRGLRDESDAIIRLADALCGFLREVLTEHNAVYQPILMRAIKQGYVTEVGEIIKNPHE